MAIRKLADTTCAETSVTATVCIVGAGVAGLVAAVRLARDPLLRVVVLESGADVDDTAVSDLDVIDNPSDNYDGAYRARGLGGTSSRWDGKLLPISRSDAAARPWIRQQGWPLDVAELDRYAPEIEEMMGVDFAPYEESVASLLDPRGLLPTNDPDFVQRWAKRPSVSDLNIADVLRSKIDWLCNIDIWLGATVSTFEFDPATDRLNTVVAVDHGGRTLTVKAEEFVIAAGALESTRLMLVADRQSGGVVSRGSDALGRYFNDHFGLDVAVVHPVAQLTSNLAFADRWTLGGTRHPHFELRPVAQQNGQVASAYFDFGVSLPQSSALPQARMALQAARQRQVGPMLRSVAKVVTGLPDLIRTAQWRYGRRKKFWPADAKIAVKVWIEQLPHWDNRIVLSDTTDSLGQPRLRFEIAKTGDEERTLRVAITKLREFWDRHLNDLATLELIPEIYDDGARLVDLTVQLAHPAGSTRMGVDPASSVVDTSLRVHAVPNLAIVSSSVFPTSGSANPTFTIIQLAMRGADALAGRLAKGKDTNMGSRV